MGMRPWFEVLSKQLDRVENAQPLINRAYDAHYTIANPLLIDCQSSGFLRNSLKRGIKISVTISMLSRCFSKRLRAFNLKVFNGLYCPSRLFHLFWAKPIQKMKELWHPQAEKLFWLCMLSDCE